MFGGTGFLGQRVVRRLIERDLSVRVAVRRPERIVALFPALHLDAIQADVNNDRSVAAAVAGVDGVVNAVSLYAESRSQTFDSVHVEAATRVARLAREAGVSRFIQVSGIGAEADRNAGRPTQPEAAGVPAYICPGAIPSGETARHP